MQHLTLLDAFIASTSCISLLHLPTSFIFLLQERAIKVTCKLENKALNRDLKGARGYLAGTR